MRHIACHIALGCAVGLSGCTDILGPRSDKTGTEAIGFATEVPIPTTAALAFVSDRAGTDHIYVADADGTNVTRLTRGSQPAWSWDGRRIAFVRDFTIFVIEEDGSERTLARGFWPSWSPDGRIAFYVGHGSEMGIHVMHADGSGARLLLRYDFAEALNPTPGYGLGHVSKPTWSPDGARIAFQLHAGYMGGTGVWVMDAEGREPRPVPGMWSGDGREPHYGGWVAWDPAWSPDGSRLAAAAELRWDYGLSSFDVVSGERVDHVLGGFPDSPSWSPDGQAIVFERTGGGAAPERRIFTVSLERGEVRQLIPDAPDPVKADYRDRYPRWSPVVR